jgi:putative ABC transport system permease protein
MQRVMTEELINVSPIQIIISMVPLGIVAWVSSVMGLNIESPILVGTIRTFLQLSILGFILDPIFVWGVDLWGLVIGYCLIMVVLASYEASARSKYYLQGQFLMIFIPMTAIVVAVCLFAFCLVLKPEPRWGTYFASRKG